MEFLDRVYDFAANFLNEEVHRSAPSQPRMGLPSACTVHRAGRGRDLESNEIKDVERLVAFFVQSG